MNTNQITVNRQGQNQGPFTLDEINRKLQAGELAPSDLAWPQGAPNWMPLSAVPGVVLTSPPPLPPKPPVAQPAAEQGDATGGVIPYKNPKALAAYYLGVFSLIPCVGLLLGVAAIALGVMGLKARKANPLVHGVVHAWIGIIVGAIVVVAHLIAFGIMATRR